MCKIGTAQKSHEISLNYFKTKPLTKIASILTPFIFTFSAFFAFFRIYLRILFNNTEMLENIDDDPSFLPNKWHIPYTFKSW